MSTPDMRRLMRSDWREVVQWLDARQVPWYCTETLLQRIQRHMQAVHCGGAPTDKE